MKHTPSFATPVFEGPLSFKTEMSKFSNPKAVLNFQKGDSKRGLTIKRIGNKKRQSTLVTCIEAYKNEE